LTEVGGHRNADLLGELGSFTENRQFATDALSRQISYAPPTLNRRELFYRRLDTLLDQSPERAQPDAEGSPCPGIQLLRSAQVDDHNGAEACDLPNHARSRRAYDAHLVGKEVP
jgi:hypothetical protein